MKNSGYSEIGLSTEAERVLQIVLKDCYADARVQYVTFLEEFRKIEDESESRKPKKKEKAKVKPAAATVTSDVCKICKTTEVTRDRHLKWTNLQFFKHFQSSQFRQSSQLISNPADRCRGGWKGRFNEG